MDDSERKQRVIGLVTQIYYALRDGKDISDPDVASGLRALTIEDLVTYKVERSTNIPLTEAVETEIDSCVAEVVKQVSSQTMTVFIQLIYLFCDLALYAERNPHAVDVPEFLRQAALRISSGEQ